MGRQVRIRLVNNDLEQLQSTIVRLGPVVFLKYISSAPTPERIEELRIRALGEEDLTVYACRPDDLGTVRIDFVKTQNYWTVESRFSPVIEVGRTYFDGKVCRGGRLWYATGYYDQAGCWIDQPPGFLRWADSVLRATRRAFHRDKELDAYLGPDALELRRQGKVEFPLNW